MRRVGIITARRNSFLVSVFMSWLVMGGCQRPSPATPPRSETLLSRASRLDTLNKYSTNELMEVLNNRGSKSVYSAEPPELSLISGPEIADSLIFRQKTLYGADRRKDYFEIQDANILRVADSVGGLVEVKRLQEDSEGFRILGKPLGETYNLCSKEAYYSQPVAPKCTAFVVASDIVATAGHCVASLGSSVIVFGFRVERASSGGTQSKTVLPKSQVYRPMRVLAAKDEPSGLDFALVKVDRPISNHIPLPLSAGGPVAKGTIVYVLGHPLGLPLKLADSAIVSGVFEAGYFVANLDTFGGNSGSPVFNAATNQVEGILARGGADFRRVGNCLRAFVCPVMPDATLDCGGEGVTLIGQLSDALKSATSEGKAIDTGAPIVKTFRSGARLSGAGSRYSAEYEVVSDPPPLGYKIGNIVYSLEGDRGCNAWSTCRTAVEGGRVIFRFSLQGHNEWPPPGQAQSEGVLTITYVREGG